MKRRVFLMRSGWDEEACGIIGLAITYGRRVPIRREDGEVFTARGACLVIGVPFWVARILLWGEVNHEEESE